MPTRFAKNITSIAIFILLLATLSGSALLALPKPAAADESSFESLQFKPQVTFPVSGSVFATNSVAVGSYKPGTGKMTSYLLARYIKTIYDYGMMIAGIVGAVVLMSGGILWLTSGGNDSRISQAKELIIGSISGLAILFCSWVLLNTINPDLLKMKPINTQVAKTQYFNESGFISNEAQIPDDMVYGWVCMNSDNQTCTDTDPPSINLDINLCYNGKPANTKPTGCGLRIWCCGISSSDVIKSNICEGESDGTPCRLNSTALLGSGYCENGKCSPCKITSWDNNGGESCSEDYECKGQEGFCGDEDEEEGKECFCNVFGQNCTCKYKIKINAA